MRKKRCTKCKELKTPVNYHVYRSGKRKGKLWPHCKSCRYAALKEWRKLKPENYREHYRRARIKTTYGISLEQYNELLEKQNSCCPVCLRHKSSFKTNLAIDHDHRTKEIIGLLCTYCNHRFIGRDRNPEMYIRAAAYLSQGTGWFVPEKKKKRRKKRSK